MCSDDELLKALIEANKLLDAVHKGLADYLVRCALCCTALASCSQHKMAQTGS